LRDGHHHTRCCFIILIFTLHYDNEVPRETQYLGEEEDSHDKIGEAFQLKPDSVEQYNRYHECYYEGNRIFH